MTEARADEKHRRATPLAQRRQLQRVHHRGGSAHVGRGEALGRGVGVVREVTRPNVHGDDRVGVSRRDADWQVVDRAAIDAQPTIDPPGREEAWQRT